MRKKAALATQAQELRQHGKSLSWISAELGVAKSSVSLWCRFIDLDEKQKNLLFSRANSPKNGALANKLKRQKELDVISQMARLEINRLTTNDLVRLKDIGTVIYWAEGTKKNLVDITNSDPEMIKVAMAWFRLICGVEESKFRACIYYHTGQDELKIRQYWSGITGIPLEQFHKSIFKKEGTGHRKNILEFGTCKIRVCDRNLLHRILTWIRQLYFVGR
jgi:hypothetical protein